jgi:uncharacterized phage protein gp47/JayE
MSYTVKSFDEIVSDIVAYIIANSPSISDLTPGSVIRSFCEGTALSIEEVYVSVYLGFRRYLANIPETVFEFPKKTGVKAAVNVVFSRTAIGPEVTIPAGTRLKTASGLVFITDSVGTIAVGVLNSGNVGCTAEEIGYDYNIGAGTLNVIDDNVEGVDSVTNALAATGGIDAESPIAYQNRFLAYIEGLARANIAGLKTAALSVEEVTSVSVVELFPPVANVNVKVYIDDGTVTGVSSEVVAEVQDIIDGDGTEDNPGYRAAGVNVEVDTPSIIPIDVTLSVVPLSGVDADQLELDLINAITAYVNGLGVGSAVIFNEIVYAVMDVYGIVDLTLTVPAANVPITATQIARVGTITILGI